MASIRIVNPSQGDEFTPGKAGSVTCSIEHDWRKVWAIPGSVRFEIRCQDGTVPLQATIPVKDNHATFDGFVWPLAESLTITAILDAVAVGKNLDSTDAKIVAKKAT